MSRPSYVNTTIQKNGTLSNWTNLSGQKIVGFMTPASLVSTTVSFNMTPSRQTTPVVSYPISGTSAPISFNVAPSGYYGFTRDQQAEFEGIEDIQVDCGSSETNGAILKLVIIPRTT